MEICIDSRSDVPRWLSRLGYTTTTDELAVGERNVRYGDIKNDDGCKRSYRFLEHMRSKARHKLLTMEHRQRLQSIDGMMNGKLIARMF